MITCIRCSNRRIIRLISQQAVSGFKLQEIELHCFIESPTSEPADGTLWYDTSIDEADIMAHNGTTFVGYATAYSTTDPNGPQFSATAPTTQSDGTALVTNDLWIDTSDLENYPKLYRYNTAATLSSTNTANQVAVTTTGAAWELVDKTDQTTEDGIVFADARLHTSGGQD